jgi:hypothetical protein
VIARRKPGVTDPATTLLALPEKKALKKIDFVDGTDSIKPGETQYVVTTLQSVQYLVACFMNQGGKKNGKPHWKLGMYGEFTSNPAV